MSGNAASYEVVTSGWPLAVVVLLVMLTCGAWLASYVLGAKFATRFPRWQIVPLRAVLGTVALWFALQLLGRWAVYASPGPLGMYAAGGALALEFLVGVYRFESTAVAARSGWALVAIRCLIALLIVLMLAQPAWVQKLRKQIERHVFVLVDDSESMQLADTQWSTEERLALADVMGVDAVADRPRVALLVLSLERMQRSLRTTEAKVDRVLNAESVDETEWLTVRGGAVDDLTVLETQRAELDARLIAWQTAEWCRDGGLRERLKQGAELSDGRLRARLQRAVSLLRSLDKDVGAEVAAKLAVELGEAAKAVDDLKAHLVGIAQPLTEAFAGALSDEATRDVATASASKRCDVVKQVLSREGEEPSLLELLSEKYTVRVFEFGKDILEVAVAAEAHSVTNAVPGAQAPVTPEQVDRSRTDVAGALALPLSEVPPESLAGVLLVGDGRHNGERSVDVPARRLGVQDVPICAVAVGSRKSPKDAAILDVIAPETVYLQDNISVVAEVETDGLRGTSITVSLICDGEVVDSKEVPSADDRFRTRVRLTHMAEEQGVIPYAVRIDQVEGEAREDNNVWDFDVAVTDERTNVLLVDAYPRWEFRYLRNLFHRRDKSVHLQYVLLKPDAIDDADPLPDVAASASRPFGESQATRLPESAEEWLKFDVIVLGDLGREALPAATLAVIQRCVVERGALLIVIAGPRSMPHAFADRVFRDLLPVEYEPVQKTYFEARETSFKLALSTVGRGHPVMLLAADPDPSRELWNSLPTIAWRHGGLKAKQTAAVLAYAEAAGVAAEDETLAPVGLEDMARDLAERRRKERENALIAVHRVGLGHVAALTFDRTWRLRYRTGDTYHHRFWGQLLRWGGGPRMRAGTENLRIGSDKVTYAPGEPIRVVSKVLSREFRPMPSAIVYAGVYKGEERVARKRLEYREGSAGLYETVLEPLHESGRYSLVLEGRDVDRLHDKDSDGRIGADVLVTADRAPLETTELTVNRELLDRVAAFTGGSVVGPDEAASLLDRFGPGSRTVIEPLNITLWDSWVLMVLLLVLLTGEWLLRRWAGLV